MEPDVDEEPSRMNVLPSAGGLGGASGAEGATGAGLEGGLGATLGFVGMTIGAGGGGDVVVGESGAGGAGAADTVEGINPDGGATGVGASFAISGGLTGSGAGGGGAVSFILGSRIFSVFMDCSGKTGAMFGPDEGTPVAGLLNGAEIVAGPLPGLVGVGGEGGGNDPELKGRMAPLPPV